MCIRYKFIIVFFLYLCLNFGFTLKVYKASENRASQIQTYYCFLFQTKMSTKYILGSVYAVLASIGRHLPLLSTNSFNKTDAAISPINDMLPGKHIRFSQNKHKKLVHKSDEKFKYYILSATCSLEKEIIHFCFYS